MAEMEPEEQDYEDDPVPIIEEGLLEEANEDDLFSRLGESSDNPEQKRMYMDYLTLIKEIDCQNKIIAGIKADVMELCGKPCKSRNEIMEIKRLRICMENENIKLHGMMNRAVHLQNFGSPRHYADLPVTTTVDEDNMSPYLCGLGACQQQSSTSRSDCSQDDPSSSGQDDRLIQTLQKAMKKMKGACPEDKKLLEEIAAAIMETKKAKTCNPGPCPSPCAAESSSSYKPPKQTRRAQRTSADASQPQPCPKSDSLDKLKRRIVGMQSSVKKLLQEVNRRETQDPGDDVSEDESEPSLPPSKPANGSKRSSVENPDPMVLCGGKRNTKADKYEKMKENYTRILTEYQRKDSQMKELEKRMKGLCGSGPGKTNGDADAAELNLLRTRVNELKEEQEEFKCIMKEQSQQLEDYRNKYLLAQQKVEEQTVSLEKLNMNNKRIEQQINTEVKEIRAKFQEKLNELLHFPKLLENEQLKLAQVCKEKDDLQGKLVVVCKELKSVKSQAAQPSTVDLRPQLAQCQLELSQTKTEIEELLRQRDLFCEQLKSTQDDLDTLRTESAKIIAGTKERAELIKGQQQEHINRLEKELAQCRATASLSVNDREAVIREMQGQLNTLSYSFDAAQKQIKTLRNHIAYVSNENCFPVKC